MNPNDTSRSNGRTETTVRSQTQLESIEPSEAVQLYLDARKNEIADSTHDSQQYRLGKFLTWCKQESIEDTTVLTGRAYPSVVVVE